MHSPVQRRLRATTAALAVAALAACGGDPSTTGPARSDPAAAGSTSPVPDAAPTPRGVAAAEDAELIAAAGRGDTDAVRRLLATGASPSARDAQGRTALIAAAYGNHLDAARVLIDAGADVDVQDDSRQSAFLIATSEVGDDPRLLDLALAAGADVQAKDSYDGTGLIRAADRGHPGVVARLLRAGVEVDHVNRLGWTALLEAVVLGDGSDRYVETVRLLLEGGADPDLPDRGGITALAHAESRGQAEVSRLLRDAGARP